MDPSTRVAEINTALRDLVNERQASSTSDVFPVWYLENYESLSEEDVESILQDQVSSRSKSALRYDPDKAQTTAYVFKHTTAPEEVVAAIDELEGELHEARNFNPKNKNVLINVVSLAESSEDILKAVEVAKQRLAKRARLVNLTSSTVVHTGLNYFMASESMMGVDVNVTFQVAPLQITGGLLGVVDARSFVPYVGDDNLLAFNIRKFLGTANKTNKEMLSSLKDDVSRFWMLNNGLVCTFDNCATQAETRVSFQTLSIVNGAQTINTVAKYIKEHGSEQPIWVVAKFVRAADRDFATKLTVASNTQSAVSTQDIRASDNFHEWYSNQLVAFGRTYIYKRGPRAPLNSVKMKDLVQAWASWKGQPHIAFSRAGSLFDGKGVDDDVPLYDSVYRLPFEETRPRTQREMIAERLLAHDVLIEVRREFAAINKNKRRRDTVGELDVQQLADIKSYKSSTHHIVWIYAELLRQYLESGLSAADLLPLVPQLVSITFDTILDNLRGTLKYRPDIQVPRDLKSDKVTQMLQANGFATNSPGQKTIVDALHELIQG